MFGVSVLLLLLVFVNLPSKVVLYTSAAEELQRACQGGKINFVIQSISYADSSNFVILNDKYIYLAKFDTNEKLNIYDATLEYKVDTQKLKNVEDFSTAIFFERDKLFYRLVLYKNYSQTLLTGSNGANTDYIMYGFGKKILLSNAVNKNGEGVSFTDEDGEVKAYDFNDVLEFHRASRNWPPKNSHFVYGSMEQSKVYFKSKEDKLPRLFSQRPTGFIQGETLYLFDVEKRITLQLPYSKVKSEIASGKNFDISFHSKTFDEFFICGNRTDPTSPTGTSTIEEITQLTDYKAKSTKPTQLPPTKQSTSNPSSNSLGTSSTADNTGKPGSFIRWIFIGIGLLVVILILLILCIVFCCKRRKKSKNKSPTFKSYIEESKTETETSTNETEEETATTDLGTRDKPEKLNKPEKLKKPKRKKKTSPDKRSKQNKLNRSLVKLIVKRKKQKNKRI